MNFYRTRNGKYVFFYEGELNPEEIEMIEENQDLLLKLLKRMGFKTIDLKKAIEGMVE